MKKAIVFGVLLLIAPLFASAQASKNAEPVFPVEAPGLIYIEGEDAVSTNFAPEANLDYASSGQRILQLNQGPQAPGAPFFAEYAFHVDATGDYELWLGGTPPGTQDSLVASYASPLNYRLDGGAAVPVYRETVNVVENYTVTNYWFMLKAPLHLTRGVHVLRLEVTEKRRSDSRYYFYLDALFMLKTGTGKLPAEVLPPSFPKNRQDRTIDNPYYTIAQYESKIIHGAKDINAYLDLARVYSLIADYPNALKVLSRAQLNIGDDPRLALLMAKNHIWSGEFEEGLRLYREYLKTNADNLAVWSESAKVVAWLGQYGASLALYQEARKTFPDDLNLLVNQGLTLLWANKVTDGNTLLGEAWSRAKTDPALIKELGHIFAVNGYPDKTIETYQKGADAWPANFEMLLLLEDALLRHGQPDLAREVKARILKTFQITDQLTAYLDLFELKGTLKQSILDSYKSRLANTPDDIKLRGELARAYFWNGRKDEAIMETHNILVNRLYGEFRSLDLDLLTSYQLIDRSWLDQGFLASAIPESKNHLSNLAQSFDVWKKAYAKVLDASKSTADPALLPAAKDILDLAGKVLAVEMARSRQLLDLFTLVTESLAGLQTGASAEMAQLAADKEALAKRQPWVWDREFSLQELNQASARGVPLADYVLARIRLLDRQPLLAQSSLNKLAITDQSPKEFRILANQADVWAGKGIEPAVLTGPDYLAYGPSLAKAEALTARPEINNAVFNDDTPTKVQDVLNELTALPTRAQARLDDLGKLVNGLHQRALARLQIHYYQFELDTFDLRFQLGDYYLNQSKYQEARVQLEKLLLLQPWNINAKFSLGRARQMSGDWAGAMQLYQEVFRTDPKFENTASLYNQLAKTHADRIGAAVTSFWDPNRTTTRSRLEFKAAGTSQVGFIAGYTLDILRLIKPVSNGASFPGNLNDPVTINLNTFDFSLPLTFSDLGLTAFVKAGAMFRDGLYSTGFNGSYLTMPTDIFANIYIAPLVSAGLGWATGPLGLNGVYTYDQLADSNFPARTPSFEHMAELTANLFFPFESPSVLRSFGSRTYGKIAFVVQPVPSVLYGTEQNTMYSVFQDLVFNFQVAEAPWTVLTSATTISWEDSTLGAKELFYYSPGQVFVAKTGLQLSSWIGLGDAWVLGLSGRVSGGLNDTVAIPWFTGEAEARFELSKGDVAIFVDLSGSMTTNFVVNNYWSLNAQIGLNIGVPTYLVP